MSRRPLLILAAVFTLAGLSVFGYKAQVLDLPLTPYARLGHWSVEARIDFLARGEPVKVTLLLPPSFERIPVLEETFVSREYGLSRLEQEGRRYAVWSIRRADGPQTLYYRFKLLMVRGRMFPTLPGSPVIRNPAYEGARLAAAQDHVSGIWRMSSDKETFVSQLLASLDTERPEGNLALLLGRNPELEARLDVAANLLAEAAIPTRIIHGLRLEDERRMATQVAWVEIHDGTRLIAFDPETAQPGVPSDYMPWWAEPHRLIAVEGAQPPEVTFSISRGQVMGVPGAVGADTRMEHPLLRFSLFSLPVGTQLVYRVLLMIPLGALLIVLLRNLVGFQTFGTFMPVLIALAFRETHLLEGVLLFTGVVLLGLVARGLLARLKLLLVPRLAAVLTVVVVLMASISIVGHLLGLQSGLSVALFPMVILTMTIERMSVVWEERGPGEAVKQGIGSMGAAVVAYLVMINDLLEYLLFAFPELLLVVLAATLLLGRYTGYRLLELPRFRALAREGD